MDVRMSFLFYQILLLVIGLLAGYALGVLSANWLWFRNFKLRSKRVRRVAPRVRIKLRNVIKLLAVFIASGLAALGVIGIILLFLA